MATRLARLYEEDFYAWTQDQARALRRLAESRPNEAVDFDRLIEEVRDLGKEQRNALRSWTVRIIEHLLLLQHSTAAGPRRGWIDEVVDFRSEIEERLTPTLRRDLQRQLPRLYARAHRNVQRRLKAYGEPELTDIGETCPLTLEQLLGDWWPDVRQAGGS